MYEPGITFEIFDNENLKHSQDYSAFEDDYYWQEIEAADRRASKMDKCFKNESFGVRRNYTRKPPFSKKRI